MYNRTYKEETFRTRTGSHSTKGSRRGYVEDWHNGLDESMLSELETREDMVGARDGITTERSRIFDTILFHRKFKNHRMARHRSNKLGAEYYEDQKNGHVPSQLEHSYIRYYLLGLDVVSIQEKLTKLNDEKRCEMPPLFMDAAREILSKETFSEILARAKELRP